MHILQIFSSCHHRQDMEQRQLLEIDEKGLKKYLDLVIREVKKVDENNH